MATIKLLKDDLSLGATAEIHELKPDTLVSYADTLLGVASNHGPKIIQNYGRAVGSAQLIRPPADVPGYSYRVDIKGPWQNVQFIRDYFEKELGVRTLIPTMSQVNDLMKKGAVKLRDLLDSYIKNQK